MRTPQHTPALQFNHEKLLRAFDEKPETLREIMRQTGQDVPSNTVIGNWLRKDRRFITSHWLPSVIVALRKAGRVTWRDVFYKKEDASNV
jgi:hypothetical protein